MSSAGLARLCALPLPTVTCSGPEELEEAHQTTQVEYVWCGPKGETRSKARTVLLPLGSFGSSPESTPRLPRLEEVPRWGFDGSSTGQAKGEDSEVVLVPVAVFTDPFRAGGAMVLCECCLHAGAPTASELAGNHVAANVCEPELPGAGRCDVRLVPEASNTRHAARALFETHQALEPWFGIEQEYTLFSVDTRWPMGWPAGGFPAPQGMYYCGVGADRAFGRTIAEAHYRACLHAGLKVSGINLEVMPGQLEFQVGPCEGIEAGDQVTMARYILHRVCELAGVTASFHPKPVAGDWNGAGAHCNFSTKQMREEGGYQTILDAVEKLKMRHDEHIQCYGDPEANALRLTGKHETQAIDVFSWGVSNRGASIRVGRDTAVEGRGYLEDRRPSSDADPYVVSAALLRTTTEALRKA